MISKRPNSNSQRSYNWIGWQWRQAIVQLAAVAVQAISCLPVAVTPVLIGAFFVFDALHVHALGPQIVVFLGLSAVASGLLFGMVHSFRCPRCNGLFFFDGQRFSRGQDRRQCAHCSLPLGKLHPDDEEHHDQ